MLRSIFKFKQFTVQQDNCAMKIGTDGVLLAAWSNTNNAKKILDIGTGTGVITLMLAQRTNAEITAIEIDVDAAKQASENAKNSKWTNRISVQNTSFQKLYNTYNQSFDLIISNPPFFLNSQKSISDIRNIARHNDFLPYKDLLLGVSKLLCINGVFSVIIPFEQFNIFVAEANKVKLYCTKKTIVYPNPTKNPKRVLLEFSKIQSEIIHDSITIELETRHTYSEKYINLTKDFYLKM